MKQKITENYSKGTYDITNGKWRYRVYVLDPFTKLRKRVSFAGETQSECYNRFLNFIKSNESGDLEKIKLYEWMNKWLDMTKKNEVSDSTYYDMLARIENHIRPHPIGKMKLTDINRIHVDYFLNDKSSNSYSLRSKLKKEISSALCYAVDNNMCRRNPCENIRLKDNSEAKIKYYDYKELQTILFFAKRDNSSIPLAIKILAYTGLRRGEMLGLMWNDIDFEKNLIHIKRTVRRIGKTATKTLSNKAKTHQSLGSVYMLPQLKQTLQSCKRVSIYVVPNYKGDYYDPSHFSKKLKKYLYSVGCSRVLGSHAFRHSLGTLLRAQGVPLDKIREVLRHSSLQSTQIYSQPSINNVKEAIEMLPY